MAQKRDIGQVFATRLKDGKKSPSKDAWNRLDVTLENEKQRKKKNLLYWLMGGGLAFLVGLYILLGTNILKNDSFSSEKNLPKKENAGFILDNDINQKEEGVKSNDSIELKHPQKTINFEENAEKIDQNNPSQLTKEGNSKKEKTNHIDESFEVTKNYYYYNSKDGKQLVTKNKEVIDSLMDENYKTPDTISFNQK